MLHIPSVAYQRALLLEYATYSSLASHSELFAGSHECRSAAMSALKSAIFGSKWSQIVAVRHNSPLDGAQLRSS